MEEKKRNILDISKNIFDIIIVVLLFLLSIKKGGFYKYDTLFFNLGILIIGCIYFFINIIIINCKNTNKKVKVDIISILLLGLSIAYMLPIFFKNYANLNDSIYEMIRYYCLFIIYNIVKKSNNKQIYINSIVIITIIQCIIGIDGIANRYLLEFFSNFRTGYLNKDLNRMSANIQYANVFAILCLISFIIISYKLLEKLDNNNSIKNNINNSIHFCLIFILLSSIILSSSRMVMIIYVLSFISIIIINRKNKNKLLYFIIINFIQIIIISIYTTLIYKNIQINLNNIYIIFLISLIVDFIIGFVINFIYYHFISIINLKINIKNNYNFNKVYISLIIFIILALFTYIVIGLNLSKPLYVSSNLNENIISRDIYDINKNNENSISFVVKGQEEDSRFKISLYSVNNDFKTELLKEFNYYNNASWEFNYNFFIKENIRNIRIDIKCEKGSIYLDKFLVNNKKQILEYAILPSTLIYRINDIIHNSNSQTDRIMYSKDAIKIIKKTFPNFLIGVGGEGFYNLYKTVQEINYTSTEVHNSFLQIFVESGIIGFMIIISSCIIVLLKSKNNVYKLIFIVLILHSIFDLDFSYMLVISIFGILLAILDININIQLKINLYNILICVVFILTFAINIIVFKANIALNIPVQNVKLTDTYLDDNIKNELIKKYELKIKLDPYDDDYKKEYESLLSNRI